MPYSRKELEKGVVGLYLAITVLLVGLGMVLSIVTITVGQQRIIQNITQSAQAYYSAEAGAEDALLRVQKNMSWSSPYTFSVGTASSTVTISTAIGGVRTIDVEGDANTRIRNSRIIYQIDAAGVTFNFGAQIGDGGMEMRSGSQIIGNVFSNSTVFLGGGGSADITESVIIAKNGSKLDGITVGQDADVHTCVDSAITGTLNYVSGGSPGNCTATTFVDRGLGEIDPAEFSITDAMITDWKADAAAGGLIDPAPAGPGGAYTISGDTTLGPVKIDGDLIIDTGNLNELTLAGAIWATGTLEFKNNSTTELDPSYGDLSGMIIADGNVFVRNGSTLRGTASPSSFLLVIGTSTSTDENDPAMEVKNNASGAILFIPNGLMVIDNLVAIVEASANQLLLKPNATVTYDVGLADVKFTTGPSGGWIVASWKEVE